MKREEKEEKGKEKLYFIFIIEEQHRIRQRSEKKQLNFRDSRLECLKFESKESRLLTLFHSFSSPIDHLTLRMRFVI